jgi:hypothetical protein
MSLIEKAITKEEALSRGAIAISEPCRNETELWIIENMIADLERSQVRWVVVKSQYTTRSISGTHKKPALELWRLT